MSLSNFNRSQLLEIRSYIEQAQGKLRSCYECQPRDEDGDTIWTVGIHSNLKELIAYDLEAPEEYWEIIGTYLDCPMCGLTLDLDSEVGVQSLTEDKIDRMWFQFQTEYGPKFSNFFDFLEKYPYLGLEHELGSEIRKAVKSLPQYEVENRVGYRARSVDSVVKTSADMYPPDPRLIKISEGRFNHFGQRVFYLANSENGAAKEALDKPGEVWLQKFQIIRATKILDLTFAPLEEAASSDLLPVGENDLLAVGLLYGRELSTVVERDKGWKPEYFVPRYIADCARLEGFKGIKYKSSRFHLENLVLFAWDDTFIKPQGRPYRFHIGNEFFDDSMYQVRSLLTKFDEDYKDFLRPFVGPFLPGLAPAD